MPGSGQDEDWVSQCQMLTARVRSALWREPRGGDGSMQVCVSRLDSLSGFWISSLVCSVYWNFVLQEYLNRIRFVLSESINIVQMAW